MTAKTTSNIPNGVQTVLGDPVMSVTEALKHLTHAKNPQQNQPDNLNVVLKTAKNRGALFIGNIMSVADPEILQDHRIKAVLSCGHNVVFNKEECSYKGIEATKAILARDVVTYDLSQHFDECIRFIQENLEANRNVLVHCHAGVSRSATIVIAYLMAKYNMFANEAIDFLKSKRECIQPNDRFMQNLKDFQKDIAKGKYLWVSQPAPPAVPAVHESNFKKSKIKQENSKNHTSQAKKIPSLNHIPSTGNITPLNPSPTLQPNVSTFANKQQSIDRHAVNGLHPSLSTGVLRPRPIVSNVPNANPSWNLGAFNLPPKPKTNLKSEGSNIRTTLFSDVGGFCSFTDTDFEHRTQFSCISKSLAPQYQISNHLNTPLTALRPGLI